MFINTIFDLYNKVYHTVCDTFYKVTTNWDSENILLNPLMISYRWNNMNYTTPFFLPFRNKEQHITILSASLSTKMYIDEEDITDYVISRAGPYHNFFMNPIMIKNIVPCSENEFMALTIMYALNGELLTFTYNKYNKQVMFHYGLDWGNFMPKEYSNVCKSLSYLDLSI